MLKKRKEQSAEPQEPQNERKVKVVYYDDGSTIADMSGTRKKSDKLQSTSREKWQTFFAVMKKMIIPCLATLAGFIILYIIILAVAGQL